MAIVKDGSIGGSFKKVNSTPPRRLVAAVDGLEKEGKTHFALTAPGPIAYCAFDIGDEGVVEKVQHTKAVHKADYFISVEKGMSPEDVMKLAMPVWDQFIYDWKTMMAELKAGHLMTGVLDTGSEAWEVLRLARFGKLTQIMPHNYTALNTEYRNLVREVFSTPGNLVILHKLKKEWINDPLTGKGNKTGNYERAGYADTGFLVQANLVAWREKDMATGKKSGAFHITVNDCRQNPMIAGLDLEGPMAHWAWLGVNVYPDTSLEDWGMA